MSENTDVGVATVRSTNPSFLADVAGQSALDGAARNVPIGYQTPLERPWRDDIEKLTAAERAAARDDNGDRGDRGDRDDRKGKKGGGPAPEPLAGLQWDMAMIHATSSGSYKKELG